MPRSHRTARAFSRPKVFRLEALEGRALLSTLPTSVPHLAMTPPSAHVAHHGAHHLAPSHPHAAHKSSPVASMKVAHPMLIRIDGFTSDDPTTTPSAGGSPPAGALTPAQARNIYGFTAIPNLGAGQTIAIVDAYNQPNIYGDANVFDQTFTTTLGGTTSYYSAYGSAGTGPTSPGWLKQVSQTGSATSLPNNNTGWGQEISLDVEWAHAIAPKATILLVEAKSASFADLLAADDYAATQANVVSNSWGGGESASIITYDAHFTKPGVTFVFSAGDSGNQSYPSTSPNVVSVGGTTLSHDWSFNWTGESGWSSGGGGVSAYEPKPTYQSSLSYANRATPDLSYDSDPNTGFAVYDTYGSSRRTPAWAQFGGTSDAAPQIAALIALADETRGTGRSLDGVSQTLPTIYGMTTGTSSAGGYALYDVTTGSNAVGSAGPGYDLVTGRGTPRFANVTYLAFVNA